jgi:hypothetical protein
MTELVHDPVSQVSYAFQPDGENLIVDCLVDPGGALPLHRRAAGLRGDRVSHPGRPAARTGQERRAS